MLSMREKEGKRESGFAELRQSDFDEKKLHDSVMARSEITFRNKKIVRGKIYVSLETNVFAFTFREHFSKHFVFLAHDSSRGFGLIRRYSYIYRS